MTKHKGTWRNSRLMRTLASIRTSNPEIKPIGNAFPPQAVIEALKHTGEEE
jgi:hypothetical protein